MGYVKAVLVFFGVIGEIWNKIKFEEKSHAVDQALAKSKATHDTTDLNKLF